MKIFFIDFEDGTGIGIDAMTEDEARKKVLSMQHDYIKYPQIVRIYPVCEYTDYCRGEIKFL